MDTIVALATGPGGAISIIRLSGPDAIAITDAVLRPASGVALADKKGYTITFGRIMDTSGETVDEVLVSLFRAPHSYTGEDMVEISAHASPYVCRRIIELLLAGGARLAEAGEFSVRAFLAGKMDLSQAEAVADVIASTDRASHALALNQMRGGYSDELNALRGELLELAALLELELDFGEEDVTFADRTRLDQIMARTEEHLAALADSFRLGNALREGIPVAIVGEPNVGKSTLLNALVREQRAMVSDIPGTTRDVIEESVILDGVRYRFLDTAGLRDTEDTLERMGIERTHASISRADIILWVVDAASGESLSTLPAPPFTPGPQQRLCVILNKTDRLDASGADRLHTFVHAHSGDAIEVIPISAKQGINLAAVTDLLKRQAPAAPVYAGNTIVANARHHEALTHARESLAAARKALSANLPADLLAEDIRQSLHHLGSITGQITTDEILGEIFSKFCIGK